MQLFDEAVKRQIQPTRKLAADLRRYVPLYTGAAYKTP